MAAAVLPALAAHPCPFCAVKDRRWAVSGSRSKQEGFRSRTGVSSLDDITLPDTDGRTGLQSLAFGPKNPEAMISLAMLNLGGYCPPLPGRQTA